METELKILVLDRGHVLVARIARHPRLAFHWRLEVARTIRRWGTEHGIAELAGGPKQGTVLDAVFSGDLPFRSLIYAIDAEEKGWKPHLS